ncbi:MAG: hypothetical protein ACSLEM_05760 [Candidatus Malihini olakiniferum]
MIGFLNLMQLKLLRQLVRDVAEKSQQQNARYWLIQTIDSENMLDNLIE